MFHFLESCFQISIKNEDSQFYPILFVAMVQNFAKKNHRLSLIGNKHNNDHQISMFNLTKPYPFNMGNLIKPWPFFVDIYFLISNF